MWIFKKARDIIAPSSQGRVTKSEYDVLLAIAKTTKLLKTKDTNFYEICLAVECSESTDELHEALIPFDRIMRVFRIAASDQEQHMRLVNALKTLGCTERFSSHMESSTSIHEAIIGYKTAVVNKLATTSQQLELLRRCDAAFNDSLITCNPVNTLGAGQLLVRSPARKRGLSLVGNVVRENISDGTDFSLRSTPPEKYTECKKRAKIKTQLTDLVNKHFTEFPIAACTQQFMPLSKKLPSSKRQALWDYSECEFAHGTKFTSKQD